MKDRVILGREGVVAAAILRDQRAERGARIGARALEHQMFEEMRDAGFAARVVSGAGLVPDHLGNRGDAVIGQHDHLQPIPERKALGIEALGRGRRHRDGGKQQKASEN